MRIPLDFRTVFVLAFLIGLSMAGPQASGEAVSAPAPDSWQMTPDDYPELKGCSKIYYVATSGDDTHAGDAGHPFRSISKAASILNPGEGVLVRSGIYRERVAPARGGTAGQPIVYMAEKGHSVFIKGSDLWQPVWKPVESRIFSARPDDAMFTDDCYWDSPNPLRVTNCATPWEQNGLAEYEYLTNPRKNANPAELRKMKYDKSLVYTLGQLFVDGRMFKQVPSLQELRKTPAGWHFDAGTSLVLVHFDGIKAPQARTVELTTRRRIFAPHQRGLGHITVCGFVMEHCGNMYPRDFWVDKTSGQAGAMGTRAGHHWTIRNNVIRFANGIGLDIGNEGMDNERLPQAPARSVSSSSHLVENNWITDHGAAGIHGYQAARMQITGNVLERNNLLRFKGFKRYESAAIKLHMPNETLVSSNLIRNNFTNGIWFDGGFGRKARINGNVIIDNAESGVFVEMGVYGPDTGIVDNNVIVGNRNAFYCHDASGVSVVHNLLANSTMYGIYLWQIGPRCNTKNHAFFNNLIVGNPQGVTINYPAELGGNIRLDHNIYSAKPADRLFVVNKFSKFNPAWTGQQFAGMVSADMNAKRTIPPQSFVGLNFDEWRRFWSRHSDSHDQASLLDAQAAVTVDSKTLELNLHLSPPALLTGSTVFAPVGNDFSGNPIPRDGQARCGPLQRVQPGKNKIKLWHGINPDGITARR